MLKLWSDKETKERYPDSYYIFRFNRSLPKDFWLTHPNAFFEYDDKELWITKRYVDFDEVGWRGVYK